MFVIIRATSRQAGNAKMVGKVGETGPSVISVMSASQPERVPAEAKDGATVITDQTINAYKALLRSLFIVTLVIILAMLVLFFVVKSANGPSVVIIVILCGALGAFFSALMRLHGSTELPNVVIDYKLSGTTLLVYALVPALVGAIAATVLYVGFASEILKSDVFPQFICKVQDSKCPTFDAMIKEWGPAAAQDYAKALLWSFVAGFSERFVPSILETLIQSANRVAPGEETKFS